MIKKKVGTITLAIGLITAGAVLFAQNFTDLPVKDIYKYWPLLLIGLGLEIIIYMSVYGRNNENVKFSIDGLCIVFIIIAAIFGGGNFIGFRHMNIQGIGDIPFIGGLDYRGQIEETINREGISKDYDIKELKLTNNFGDIEIRPGKSNEIRLEAMATVQYRDETKAKNYVKNAIKIEEGEVTNIYIEDISNFANKDYNKAMVDFTVYIPEGITLDIKNSFGTIEIEGGGNIDARNSNGEINIKEAAGNIDARTSFGDIELRSVKGNVKAESSNGDVEIFEVNGNIDAKTSFGNVRLDEKSIENGKVSAETSFGSLRGFKDPNVQDSGQKKSLDAVYGNGSRNINLRTSNGNIEIR